MSQARTPTLVVIPFCPVQTCAWEGAHVTTYEDLSVENDQTKAEIKRVRQACNDAVRVHLATHTPDELTTTLFKEGKPSAWRAEYRPEAPR